MNFPIELLARFFLSSESTNTIYSYILYTDTPLAGTETISDRGSIHRRERRKVCRADLESVSSQIYQRGFCATVQHSLNRLLYNTRSLFISTRKTILCIVDVHVPLAWLAQLGERQSAEREAKGSNPGRKNSQSL